MPFYVMSAYHCIGAGDLQLEKDRLSIHDTLEAARSRFSQRLNTVKTSIANEIETIETSSNLIFDSDYFVWVAIFEATAKSEDEFLSHIEEAAEQDEPVEFLNNELVAYEGFYYDPDEQEYPSDQAIAGLLGY